MNKKIFLIILISIIIISFVQATTITKIDDVTAPFQKLNNIIAYSNGTDILYIDSTGNNLGNIPISNADTIVKSGINVKGEETNLFYLSPTTKLMYNVSYSEMTYTTYNFSSILSSYSAPELVAVLPDYYIFTYATNDFTIGMYRNNNTIFYVQTSLGCPGTSYCYPRLANYNSGTGWYYNTRPVYFNDTSFLVLSYYFFGATEALYSNFISVEGVTIKRYLDGYDAGNYSTFDKLTDAFSFKQGVIGTTNNVVTNLNSDIYINGGNHNSNPSSYNLDKNNGLFGSYYTYYDLPNGTTLNVSSYIENSDGYKIVEDRAHNTYVLKNNALLVDAGIITPDYSTNGYIDFLGNNIIYISGGTNLYIVTGLPDSTTPPLISLFVRNETIDSTQEYAEKKNRGEHLFFDETLVNDIEIGPISSLTSALYEIFGSPFWKTESNGQSIRTEYDTTDLMLRSYDIVDDNVNYAIDCNYGDIDNTLYINGTMSNYTDSLYHSAVVANITALPYSNGESAIVVNSSLWIGNLYRTLDLNDAEQYSFIQKFYIGNGKDFSINFYNIYGDEMFNVSIKDSYVGLDLYSTMVINGQTLYNVSGTSLNGYRNRYFKIVLIFNKSEIIYNLYKGSDVIASGQLNKIMVFPLSEVEWNIKSPDIGGNVYLGNWYLYKNNIYPTFGDNIYYIDEIDGYRYYFTQCLYGGSANENKQIRIWYDDVTSNDYGNYNDYYINYNVNYIDYIAVQENLPEFSTNKSTKLIDEERDAARNAEVNNAMCRTINICSDNDRLLFAVFTMLLIVGGTAGFLYSNYEATPINGIVTGLVYVGCFTLFAALGWLPTWYIIMNIIGAAAVIAINNPINRAGRM